MSPPPSNSEIPRLLVVAPDVVGERMAGPGIRYVEIAKALAPTIPVTFAIGVEGSGTVDFGDARVDTRKYTTREELEHLVDSSDVVFCQFIDTNVVKYALGRGKRVVYDLYNVLPVEAIGSERISGFSDVVSKDREYAELLSYFRFCCVSGSYFVASNERQRDYWLGFLMAAGALSPSNLDKRALAGIIGLLPFGMDAREPRSTRHGLRGRHGISDDDFIVIWAGGIWDWFDAETPIRAVAQLVPTHPDLKLVFYGTTHPNSAIGKPAAVTRAEELAGSLGVLGSNVIFLDEWVPFHDRENFLLDADIALSAHKPSLETHYAFRTRILDHFWAELPSVVSTGDWFAEYIETHELGLVVPCEDVHETADALLRFKNDPELRRTVKSNVSSIRDQWHWAATVHELKKNLIAFRSLPSIVPEEPAPPAEPEPEGAETRSSKARRKVASFLRRTPLRPLLRWMRNAFRRG